MFPNVPLGDPVPAHAARTPEPRILTGRYVTLEPTSPSHASSLYCTVCDESTAPSVFPYMAVGPFANEQDFAEHVVRLSSDPAAVFFTVLLLLPNEDGAAAGSAVGYLSLMNIDPVHRTIEIGNVTFAPALQRTTAATEAMYLAMKYCIEDLGNRRLEWKCDSLNAKSRRAAERLGFTYEGLFRKHRIVRGRDRDTAWFSIVDDEWPSRAADLEAWLDPANFDAGKQIRSLDQIRNENRVGGVNP